MWSHSADQALERVIYQVGTSRAEVSTLIQSVRILTYALHGEHLEQLDEALPAVEILKLVAEDHSFGDVDHRVLEMGLYHADCEGSEELVRLLLPRCLACRHLDAELLQEASRFNC